MSILNVDKIQPIGGGSTITVDATDIQASTGTIRASTFSGDVSATGIGVTSLSVAGITTFSDNVKISSNKKLTFNNPGFEIYHDNANAYLDNNVGHLYIRNDVDGDTNSNIYIQAKSGENGVSVGNDGSVVLFYNNNLKFQTTNTGTYTTGIGTFTDKISVIGSQNSMLTSNQLIFDRAGTSYVDNSNDSGALSFRIGSSYTVGLFIESDGTVAIPSKLVHLGDTNTFMEFGADTISFDTAGTERLRIQSNGYVNIGSGTAEEQLTVRNTTQHSLIRIISANNSSAGVDFGDPEDTDIGRVRYYHSDGSNTNYMRFDTNASERVRITSGGHVNIGGNYTQTSKRLYVDGTAEFTSNITCVNQIYLNGVAPQLVFTDTNQDSDYTIKNDSGSLQFIDRTNSNAVRMYANTGGFGGDRLYIANDIVHTGDTDTKIAFSDNTIVVTAGNSTKMNINNTMVEINGSMQRQGGRTYTTNSTSTWQTIFSFSNATTNGFFFECAVSENNYSTIYKVGGSPNWNSCYFTSDHAGDSQHSHSSDITFRILNDSGTKRLQFKAVSYTTTRYLYAINVWVRTGYVNWA